MPSMLAFNGPHHNDFVFNRHLLSAWYVVGAENLKMILDSGIHSLVGKSLKCREGRS